jgi:hypothetical protein
VDHQPTIWLDLDFGNCEAGFRGSLDRALERSLRERRALHAR